MSLKLLALVVLLHSVSAEHHHEHKHHQHQANVHKNVRVEPEIIDLKTALFTPEDANVYVVLVAGSNGWYNYRHQADVAHAYHTIVNHGIPKENIITMMYDDVASSKQNPYPGKLYNRPHGGDVYQGIKIDYKGKEVTPANFIAILTGNKQALKGGNGRVLESGPNDRVFIYFTDHGATGLISFPEGILTVQSLQKALMTAHSKQRFGQLVFYLEACESGSMFEKWLKNDINVYAISAANGHESSWGTYCENDMGLPCLGDLFSVAWMEDSDVEDLKAETLEKQFELVKNRTNKSHVQHFGDLSIANEPVSYFQGAGGKPKAMRREMQQSYNSRYNVHWPSRDIELNHLMRQRDSTNDIYERKTLSRRIAEIHETRRSIKTLVHEVVHAVIPDKVNRRLMFEERRDLTQFTCHHEVVHAFHDICIDFNKYEYALKYVYVLANLCEELKEPDAIVAQLISICPDTFFV